MFISPSSISLLLSLSTNDTSSSSDLETDEISASYPDLEAAASSAACRMGERDESSGACGEEAGGGEEERA